MPPRRWPVSDPLPPDPPLATRPGPDRPRRRQTAGETGGEASSMRVRLFMAGIAALVAFGTSGCASVPGLRAVAENPMVVPSADFETVWKAAVTSVDEYFDIASENRLQGKIVTQPK